MHTKIPAIIGSLVMVRMLIATNAVRTSETQQTNHNEFCGQDLFEASCSGNKLIAMVKASYGRMRIGKCVRSDAGYLGCSADVLHIIDRWCSGRRSCQARVSHPELFATQPCFELTSYLEAEYLCLPVITAPGSGCWIDQGARLSSDGRVLASLITDESGCGGVRTPWIVEATPGQQIAVEMIDFGAESPTNDTHITTNRCIPYGFIIEKSTRTNKPICGGASRQKTIYTSNTHQIQLQINAASQRKDKQFLLMYQFIGCSDLQLQEDLTYTRDGPKVTVSCRWTKQSWNLACISNQWSGVVGNCSKHEEPVPQTSSSVSFLSDSSMLIIICGSAVLISILLVTIFLLFGLSRWRSVNRRCETSIRNSTTGQHYLPAYCSGTTRNCGHTINCNTGKDMIHVWQRPLPAPLIPTPFPSDHEDRTAMMRNTNTLNSDRTNDSESKYYVLEQP